MVLGKLHAAGLQEQGQPRQRVDPFLRARSVRRDAGDLDFHVVAGALHFDGELAARGVAVQEFSARLFQRGSHGGSIAAGNARGGGLGDGVGRGRAAHGNDGRSLVVGLALRALAVRRLDAEGHGQRARAFFRHHRGVFAVEHDVVLGQGGVLAVVLHAVAAGFLGGLDHQADGALQRHAAFLDGLHGIHDRGDRALVVDGAAPVQRVAHARHAERIQFGAVLQHPFLGHRRHHVGVGQDAEGVLGAAGQRDLEDPVVDIAVGQPEVTRHGLDHLAEVDDGGVLVLRDLLVAHGTQRHHPADGVDHRGLVVDAVVDAQQAADISQVVAGQRRPGLPRRHGRRHRRLGFGRGGHECLQVGVGCRSGAGDQRIQGRFLQGLRLRGVRQHQ
ncbi:hypothetical protein D9M72_354970 [compost metagenome]